MGFSHEFECRAIEVLGEEDEVGREILKDGDRREMLIHLLERMETSPLEIQEHLEKGEQAELQAKCRKAEPLWELLMFLLQHEMLFGISIKRSPPTSEDLDKGALAM